MLILKYVFGFHTQADNVQFNEKGNLVYFSHQ